MAFKDRCTWGLDVFSIDKHFMAIAHLLWPIYQYLHAVASPQNPPKTCRGFLETQRGQILKLPFIISERLTVSVVTLAYQF